MLTAAALTMNVGMIRQQVQFAAQAGSAIWRGNRIHSTGTAERGQDA